MTALDLQRGFVWDGMHEIVGMGLGWASNVGWYWLRQKIEIGFGLAPTLTLPRRSEATGEGVDRSLSCSKCLRNIKVIYVVTSILVACLAT